MAGRIAVVTGGASGIGRGIALALAEKGAAGVIVADVDEARAAEVAREVDARGAQAWAERADVSREAEVEALAERVFARGGRVELLFNNAGVGGGGPLLDAASGDLHWLFAVNVFGVWYGCRAFGRRWREAGTRAWIVNTGSEHSLGMPHTQSGFYTATKHALLGLSDVLRHELPPAIGISILCPGVVRTEIWNAGRNRPAELGGPVEGTELVRSILQEGMDPLEIGRRAVEGVEREEFYIVTHPHARDYADRRHQEICAAFERQAPRAAGDERYEVLALARRVLENLRGPQGSA